MESDGDQKVFSFSNEDKNIFQLSHDLLEEQEPVETHINQFDDSVQTGFKDSAYTGLSDPYARQEQFQTNLNIYQDLEEVQSSHNQFEEQAQASFNQVQEPVQTSFIQFDHSDISALLLDMRENSLSNLHLPFSSTYSGRPDHSRRLSSQRKVAKTSEPSCSTPTLKLSPKESFKKAVREEQLARAGIFMAIFRIWNSQGGEGGGQRFPIEHQETQIRSETLKI